MRRNPINDRFCPNTDCQLHGCYYNFVRPHMALKSGKQMLTPAMQAGPVSRRLTFRDIFTEVATLFLCVVILLLRKSVQEQDESLRLAT